MWKKKNRFFVGLLSGFVIATIIVIVLFITKNIDIKFIKTNNNNNELDEVTFNNEKIYVPNLVKENIHISSSGIQSIYPLYDYYIDLCYSGKVKIRAIGMSEENSRERYEKFLSNIENAIDIIEFNSPATPEFQLIYVLLENGDVYYYTVGDSVNN